MREIQGNGSVLLTVKLLLCGKTYGIRIEKIPRSQLIVFSKSPSMNLRHLNNL